ncbi:MAG TPA: NADP-dependent oxidoreductase, partial [Polyangia bacterium]|nr:NADP-dependent oxidoreductase [Polyangia bacterium]
MRGWMNEQKSYVAPVKLGDVMRAFGGGRVTASNDPALAVGDYVTGMTGVQSHALLPAKHLQKIDTNLAPLPRWLGALGMTGATAYFGLIYVGEPQEGETVVVSGAAGATGTIVGQIAKIKGCHVVGIAGGPAKCRYLVDELGFDAAIDYKSEDVYKALKQHCPDGIDVYFDNVGGEILESALAQLRLHARVVICGAISQYNNTGGPPSLKNYLSLLVNRARMEGFLVSDYFPRMAESVRAIAGWIAAGKLKAREDIVEGLEDFPIALGKLFAGENFGKLLLEV